MWKKGSLAFKSTSRCESNNQWKTKLLLKENDNYFVKNLVKYVGFKLKEN